MVISPSETRKTCSKCLRPVPVCYCGQIPCQQENSWSVCIIQDIRESGHAIGTARMAALSLSQCQLFNLNPDNGADSTDMDELRQRQPVLIYPGEQAGDVSELSALPKAPLLFIDASWRRSRKILMTQSWIKELPRFALNSVAPSRYRIRKQPTDTALSTLEAIVYTLQQLETEPARFNKLLTTLDWVVDQQIKHMGSAIWQSNYENVKKEF